ncbi:hypothetical protein BD324DRAFT_635382 [Kockovaella imperatae]|uniref:Alkyl hydroperoxide reductase subunit C/ Thiol specific antioxidant domain-containing protein n=1 Tax=Kockovaella imperatae TaxID=4999 RepID=A0A1Y1UA23_9TREE|nr:hypothetical protein BD324DRAFT_635382 [Kockovaella imperatae]ORX34862.1 hypothetical protein BD324DRAFT_635382 [Kockovaella imperatae]
MVLTQDVDSVAKYQELKDSHRFLFVIFYRGHWCPFCLHYVKELQRLRHLILKAGGETLIVTAEPAEHLPAMLKNTKYDGPVTVDPELQLASFLKGQGTIEVTVSSKAGYPHGMNQLAVLIITKEGLVLEKYGNPRRW